MKGVEIDKIFLLPCVCTLRTHLLLVLNPRLRRRKTFQELVFSQHGSVKRTKVYRNEAGEAKGDGLVTFAKPASVDLAVAKMNGHEISVGYPISVSMADFNRTKSGTAAEEPPPQQQQQEASSGEHNG
ncbi:unnamed protein product, partial [Ectocarpus sp. 6 AP-2014]